MKIGETFQLFQTGIECNISSINGEKVRFTTKSGMTGSFPTERISEHLGKKPKIK